jgi:transcriptional regulator with XRE-family HTH domain
MISKKNRKKYPEYLLTKYQLEIYCELLEYKEKNELTQSDLAKKLGVSNSYISQVLNGNFNFTLKKLIELGLLIGKIPALQFVDIDEYFFKQDNLYSNSRTIAVSHLVKQKIHLTKSDMTAKNTKEIAATYKSDASFGKADIQHEKSHTYCTLS